MSDEPEDMGMRIRRVLNRDTVNSDIAVKLAEMVIRYNYGYPDSRELPLTIKDQGDRWEVRSKLVVPAPHLDNPDFGEQILIIIMKSNCKIIQFETVHVRIEP